VRLRLAAAALLALRLALAPAGLRAYGGTMQAGLDGTQPWDTVPQAEADLELWGYGGDGHPALGPGLRLGLTDWLQASGAWRAPLGGQAQQADLGLQLREPEHPDRWPALALMADAPYDGAAWQPRGGLVAQVEPFDSSLTLNALWGANGWWGLRGGLWTPYVTEFLRLGAELASERGGLSACTPQLLLNGPGDISLALGCRIGLPGRGLGWALRLSYDLFPNP
jgi:hypothetical protein